MPNITIFIPDLFYYPSGFRDDTFPRLDALELLLARATATRHETVSYYRAVCDLLNFPVGTEQDIPVAAVSRLIDAEERPEGQWACADPVHLHADRDSLLLFDIPPASLSQHDALVLAAEIREIIQAHGWEIEVPMPDRWYIQFTSTTSMRTTELDRIIGYDIQGHLPLGDNSTTWNRLLTELQMQLHNSDVNAVRQEGGELTINSIWIWGTGELPEVFDRTWTTAYGDDSFVKGLCMLSSTPCSPLPDNLESLFAENDTDAELLVVKNLRHEKGQGEVYQDLEQNWFAPLLRHMQDGSLKQLKIITRQDSFQLQKNTLKKFWRRKKPFRDYYFESG